MQRWLRVTDIVSLLLETGLKPTPIATKDTSFYTNLSAFMALPHLQ